MVPMSDDTSRTALEYVGAGPAIIGGNANPVPAYVTHGDPVEVDADYAEGMIASGRFTAGAGRDDGILRGATLDEALDRAGLPRTGSADEKRRRLAEHELDPQLDGGPAGDDPTGDPTP